MALVFPTESTAPLPVEDPNGVYPTLDGIAPASPADVPAGFDLIALLSESMRARPQWRDMAAAASRVVYEYVERTRLALQLSRDPRVLARTLKIATLRMIGLDWSSTLLNDADYDRALFDVAAFMQQNGPQHFARYMGYALGVPMQLVPLWTRDYAAFTPGPPMTAGDLIFDANGTSYPTSHVDLVYELFSTRGAQIDAYQTDVRDLFDDVAPIHLVLEWIVAQITLSIGTLYLGTLTFDDGDDTVVVENPAVAMVTVAGQALINAYLRSGTPTAYSRIAVGTVPSVQDTMATSDTGDDVVTSDTGDDIAVNIGASRDSTGVDNTVYETANIVSRATPTGMRFYVVLGSDVGGWSIATVGIYAGSPSTLTVSTAPTNVPLTTSDTNDPLTTSDTDMPLTLDPDGGPGTSTPRDTDTGAVRTAVEDVLVAVAEFPVIGTKRMDNLPSVRGDVRTLIIDVPYALIAQEPLVTDTGEQRSTDNGMGRDVVL